MEYIIRLPRTLRFVSSQINMSTKVQSKRVAVALPEETRTFLEKEAQDTGVALSNLLSYITVNYVRDEKKKRASS